MTGCAGFISSNMVLYMLHKYTDIIILNPDALTYAGNMENLKDVEEEERHIFVRGDIGDKDMVTRLLAEYDPDYVINLAAESHVDRSIANPMIFVDTNVRGTVNLLQCCKEAWYDAGQKTLQPTCKCLPMKCTQTSGNPFPAHFEHVGVIKTEIRRLK